MKLSEINCHHEYLQEVEFHFRKCQKFDGSSSDLFLTFLIFKSESVIAVDKCYNLPFDNLSMSKLSTSAMEEQWVVLIYS